MYTDIFLPYMLCLSLIINFAEGMSSKPIKNHLATIESTGSASYTADQILLEDLPAPRNCVKQEDNIVFALKFDKDNTYQLTRYTRSLLPYSSSYQEQCFMKNALFIIPMYYEKLLINEKGEYKIWGKKIDLIQFTVQLANMERFCIDLFNIDDKAYKKYLHLIGRNNTADLIAVTNEVYNKINKIFKNPQQLTLDQLDFFPNVLLKKYKIRVMNKLLKYFDEKKKLNDKLQYFYSVWQKMIFKNINELLRNNQISDSYKVLASIGVDNFIKQIKNIKQLLDNVWLNLNAVAQEYEADEKKITLNNIVDFNDPEMSNLKKLSIQATYRSLANNRYTIRQFFESIDNLLKPLITMVRCKLGNSYSFNDIKNISEPLTKELIPEILKYYSYIIVPQLINLIITNVYFTNQNCIPNYMDDLKIIKNGLELIEESLFYYQWG